MTIKPPPMKTMTVGEFKAQFSAVLDKINDLPAKAGRLSWRGINPISANLFC